MCISNNSNEIDILRSIQSHRSIYVNFGLYLLLALTFGSSVHSASSEVFAWRAKSKDGLFSIELGPQQGELRINTMQSWTVTIKDALGADVYPARVLLEGGMRDHGHGLPTQPQLSKYLGGGRYLIEGVRLNMVGSWTLLVGVEYGGRRDFATFEIVIDY